MLGKVLENKNVIAVFLLVATIASWLTFEKFHGVLLASVLIVLISTLKVKAIMASFMEVGLMPGPWKHLLNAWLAVVCLSMIIAEVV